MAAFSPTIIPLGSLADAAAAGAEVARQEQVQYAIGTDIGTTTGIIDRPDDSFVP
ncbi:hypothetical protein [Longimicrobium sp.]|uniref:hypothetical protein n=1 Tax=Longimicrobium sp. TaxID=2029185 RepID=UPI002E36B244|nr:hypothetical protein [Longimicrobium sp.]HEX6041408.1 hypothetical protein [Longimicrobium sp.]